MSLFLKTYLLLFLVVKLARSGIESDGDLLAGLVAGRLDGFQNKFDGFVVGLERGSKAAFVAHGGVVALLLEHALEGVEGLRGPAQRVREALGADGHDHEFLEVHVGVGMRAAVEHVEHGRGQDAGVDAAQVAIERNLQRLGHGAGGGHGDSQDGVGAQLALVGRAVERDHGLVEEALVGGVHAFQFGSNDGLNVGNGLENALAQVVALVAVAQFHGLMFAGGGARGHNGAAQCAAFQNYVCFHGGIAARIQGLRAHG